MSPSLKGRQRGGEVGLLPTSVLPFLLTAVGHWVASSWFCGTVFLASLCLDSLFSPASRLILSHSGACDGGEKNPVK